MGVEDNDFDISDLDANTTFFEWASKTNTDIIGKLNRMRLYDGISGDGINVVVGTTTITEAGSPTPTTITAGDIFVEMSGTVAKGVTFNGDVSINGTLNYDFSQAFGGVKTVSIGFSGATAGLTAGDLVRFDADLNGLTLASADSATNAEVLGIVNGENNNLVSVTTHGFVGANTLNIANGGLSAGCIHFLDPDNPGRLTNQEPNIIGQVSKPVFLATGATSGIFYNYRGQLLTGTGGTGDTQADNNAFFLTTSASGLAQSVFDTFTVGKVISYDGDYKLTELNNTESIVGIVVAEPSSTVIKVVTSGFISDSPVNKTGPLRVNADSELSSDVTTGPIVAVGAAFGSDTILVFNPTLGAANNFNGGTGGQAQYARNAFPNVGGTTASTGGVSYVNDNLLVNGSMSIWQRDQGVSTSYTGTGSVYFADRWVRLNNSGNTSSGTLSFQRQNFTTTQGEVEGNPLYYTRFNTNIPGNTFGDIIQFEHRTEDSASFRGENMALGFYAKAASSGQTATVFIKQNTDGSSTETKTNLSTIELSTDWRKFITLFSVPELTATPSGDHYFAVGLDITHATGNVDFAQFKLERGSASTPVEPRTIESEYELCARYYQRSYAPDVSTRTVTTLNKVPDATSVNFSAIPSENDHYYRYPVRMRETPNTVTLFSPHSGDTADAFNRSYGDDLSLTTGSTGKDLKVRSAPVGQTTIEVNRSTRDGFIVDPITGFVDFDRISVHYVSDADLNNNISNVTINT